MNLIQIETSTREICRPWKIVFVQNRRLRNKRTEIRKPRESFRDSLLTILSFRSLRFRSVAFCHQLGCGLTKVSKNVWLRANGSSYLPYVPKYSADNFRTTLTVHLHRLAARKNSFYVQSIKVDLFPHNDAAVDEVLRTVLVRAEGRGGTSKEFCFFQHSFIILLVTRTPPARKRTAISSAMHSLSMNCAGRATIATTRPIWADFKTFLSSSFAMFSLIFRCLSRKT